MRFSLFAKRVFWKLPLPSRIKELIRCHYSTKKDASEKEDTFVELTNEEQFPGYICQVLNVTNQRSVYYRAYKENSEADFKNHIIAFYLTQFYPNKYNDKWYGKGTTEWTGVTKSAPQFVGHYQPRLPGELGFYDLRIIDNMAEQIRIAKNYGIKAFCFYYYWFDGKRMLEKPLNGFMRDKSLDMPFCICWANENWTRKYTGSNSDVLMENSTKIDSCIRLMHDLIDVFLDPRYYCLGKKLVFIVYRPSQIEKCGDVLIRWREIVKKKTNKDMYIIAVQEKGDRTDWVKKGFDAETEFQPKRVSTVAKNITQNISFLNKNYKGTVYDYEDLVVNRKYIIKSNKNRKVYHAVMPMWDNTPRRNNSGIIFQGSTPDLYAKWLDDIIKRTKSNYLLDHSLIFVNAWNEWGEGAYLEPDRMYGYAYLEKTYDVLKKNEN